MTKERKIGLITGPSCTRCFFTRNSLAAGLRDDGLRGSLWANTGSDDRPSSVAGRAHFGLLAGGTIPAILRYSTI